MAISNLKNYHPYLYYRIRLKGILFTALGLSSLFSPLLDHLVRASNSRASTQAGLNVFLTGGVFLLIGVLILWGLYSGPENYKKSRKFLLAAFMYALFWEFLLLGMVITRNVTTLSVTILWSYLTYNLFIIYGDSGWEAAEIVKDIQENGNGGE